MTRVPDALDERLPARVLVNLVEDQQVGFRRPLLTQDYLAMIAVVPVKVGRRFEIVGNPLRERCLSHLPRTADKNHFLVEVLTNRRLKVSWPGVFHILIILQY